MRAARAAVAAGRVTAAATFVHLVPGVVAFRSMRCRLFPRLSGVGDAGHVALTFDDGPDAASTPAFLDALDRLGWKATFFCLGSQVRRFPGLAAELIARGHEVGVHGDNHRSHLRLPAPLAVRNVQRARETIEDATGVRVRWFRPPYGAVSAATLVAAKSAEVDLVLWTTWGRDWRKDSTGATVVDEVTKTFHPGATVLLHDSDLTSSRGSWRATLDALPVLAERWSAAGLGVGPLSEHGLARHMT